MTNWLEIGDLDLFFKLTAVEKLKIHSGGHQFSLKMLLHFRYLNVLWGMFNHLIKDLLNTKTLFLQQVLNNCKKYSYFLVL